MRTGLRRIRVAGSGHGQSAGGDRGGLSLAWMLGLGALGALVLAGAVAAVLVSDSGQDSAGEGADNADAAPVAERQPAGSWSAGGRLPVRRHRGSAAVRLRDGGVLVVGGGSVASSASVWDPEQRQAQLVGELTKARKGHTATRLDNGQVLAAGGEAETTAEVYDPRQQEWQSVEPMEVARQNHTATRLADGRVLMVGGRAAADARRPEVQATAEIYDPDEQAWASVTEMDQAREQHTATRLEDGRVLVAGGADDDGEPVDSVEVFDPQAQTWQPAAPLGTARQGHAAVRLDDGRVLVAGGDEAGGDEADGDDTDGDDTDGGEADGDDGDDERPSTAEAYAPDRDAWTGTASTAARHPGLSATLLDDGTVVVVGGETAERYDPDADQWWEVAPPHGYRGGHAAVALPNGDVVVIGGKGSGRTAEVFRPEPTPGPVVDEIAPARGSVAGGFEVTISGQHFGETVFVEVGAQRVRDITRVSPQQLRVTVPAQPAGEAPVAVTTPGGTSEPVTLAFDAEDGRWESAGKMTTSRIEAGLAVLDTPACRDRTNPPAFCGQVLVISGEHSDRYDPEAEEFTSTAALPASVDERFRSGGRTTVLDGPACRDAADPPAYCGRVLAVDDRAGDDEHTDTALYDPQADSWQACGADQANAECPAPVPGERVYRTVGLDGPACREAADPPAHCGTVLAVASVFTDRPPVWRYEPATGQWQTMASPAAPREMFTLTLVDGEACAGDQPPEACGQVLLASGTTFEPGRAVRAETAELYDPATDSWRETRDTPQPGRSRAAAVGLADGRVLLAGGYLDPDAADTAEIFDPVDESWQPISSLPEPRQGHAAVALADGGVLIAGGDAIRADGRTGPTRSALRWNPATGEWAYTASLATPRHGGTNAPKPPLPATALPDGTALVVGGIGGQSPDSLDPLESAERYDPTTDSADDGGG